MPNPREDHRATTLLSTHRYHYPHDLAAFASGFRQTFGFFSLRASLPHSSAGQIAHDSFMDI
jgi:hypothetical protein